MRVMRMAVNAMEGGAEFVAKPAYPAALERWPVRSARQSCGDRAAQLVAHCWPFGGSGFNPGDGIRGEVTVSAERVSARGADEKRQIRQVGELGQCVEWWSLLKAQYEW